MADGVCDWMALEAERDDANMQATANNEAANSLHEQLKDARALLRELVKAAHVITDDRYVDEWGKAQIDDDDLVALEDVLARVEAEAGEESKQKMNLEQALAILAREKHNGYAQWDGTCPPSNPAWRTEFEVIAIAEAYERKREPDPCTAPTTTAGERSEG